MADAYSIQQANDGTTSDGKMLPWRIVHLLREAQIGDLSSPSNPDQESPNTSASLYDHVTTLAKVLTRRYKGKDLFDMVCEIHDKLVDGK